MPAPLLLPLPLYMEPPGPSSARRHLKWHSLATLITCMMTLFIQRAKLGIPEPSMPSPDELMPVHGDAKNEIMQIAEKEPEQIERFRASQTEIGPAGHSWECVSLWHEFVTVCQSADGEGRRMWRNSRAKGQR